MSGTRASHADANPVGANPADANQVGANKSEPSVPSASAASVGSWRVRRAGAEDATEAAALLRESITELCVADHQNDPETLRRWLSNKVPNRVEQLIVNADHVTVVVETVVAETVVGDVARDSDSDSAVLDEAVQKDAVFDEAVPTDAVLGETVVAKEEQRLLGVGLVTSKGEVQLCYVRPRAIGRGVGRALLLELERISTDAGLTRTFLTSTSGARDFYEHAGYVATGPGCSLFGTVVGYPYEKWLRAHS